MSELDPRIPENIGMQLIIGSEPATKRVFGEERKVTSFIGKLHFGEQIRYCFGFGVGEVESFEDGKFMVNRTAAADPLELLLSMHVLNGTEEIEPNTLANISSGVQGFLKTSTTDFSSEQEITRAAEHAEAAIEAIDPEILASFVEMLTQGSNIVDWTSMHTAMVDGILDTTPNLSDWVTAQTN